MTRRININWDSMPLGEAPDSVLADSLGCSTWAVRRQRMKRKIPAFVNGYQIDWSKAPFLRYTDAELAEKYGVPVRTVLHHRLKMGIRRDAVHEAVPPTVRTPPGTIINGEPPVSWLKERIQQEKDLYGLE